jgi:hypothetical protein
MTALCQDLTKAAEIVVNGDNEDSELMIRIGPVIISYDTRERELTYSIRGSTPDEHGLYWRLGKHIVEDNPYEAALEMQAALTGATSAGELTS